MKGLIDSETDAGCEGFNGLNIVSASREANYDSDLDGIPNWFEKAKGWNENVANNNADSDNNGYTDLEDYLNWMALPHFIVPKSQQTTIGLSTYFASYTKTRLMNLWVVMNSASAMMATENDSFMPGNINGFYTVNVTVPMMITSLTRTFNFYVSSDAAGSTRS